MKFSFAHNNLNVTDLDKSLRFYEEALGLKAARTKEASDGSFILAFLTDGVTPHQLELTWLRDWKKIPMIWETTNSTWPLLLMTWRLPMRSTGKWAASALKMRLWESIL